MLLGATMHDAVVQTAVLQPIADQPPTAAAVTQVMVVIKRNYDYSTIVLNIILVSLCAIAAVANIVYIRFGMILKENEFFYILLISLPTWH